MIPDIPDVFPLIGLALSILLGPIYYGRTKTTALPTSQKEATK